MWYARRLRPRPILMKGNECEETRQLKDLPGDSWTICGSPAATAQP